MLSDIAEAEPTPARQQLSLVSTALGERLGDLRAELRLRRPRK
jgi:hypothetical protein